MAKYDQGGGCPCGLYRECEPGCISDPNKWAETQKELQKKMIEEEYVAMVKKQSADMKYEAYHDRMKKEFPGMYDAPIKNVSATRPWGEWHVLDVDQGYKVKRLHILPDQSISLQYHVHRSEHWTIVQGEGKVIVDGNIFKVTKGESFHVPKQALHKITNTHLTETLIAIEVQMGDICSEDDIVRC